MKDIVSLLILVSFVYFISTYVIKIFCNITWQEARHKLNEMIVDFFKTPPPPIRHDICLTENDMRAISKIFQKYFQICLFQRAVLNNTGATIYIFEVHMPSPKFLADLDMFKTILVSEIKKYLMDTYYFMLDQICVVKIIEGELVIAIGTSPEGRKYIQERKLITSSKRTMSAASEIVERIGGNEK